MATEYISTETGCQYLRKYKIEDGTSFLYDEGFNDGIETAISCIGNEVPAADVRPVVRGRWIRGRESMTSPGKDSYTCSACGEKTLSGFCGNPAKTNFCPNCGCAMENEK